MTWTFGVGTYSWTWIETFFVETFDGWIIDEIHHQKSETVLVVQEPVAELKPVAEWTNLPAQQYFQILMFVVLA